MDDDEPLVQALRRQLDDELGQVAATASARRRLRDDVPARKRLSGRSSGRPSGPAGALLVAGVVVVVVAVPVLVVRSWPAVGSSRPQAATVSPPPATAATGRPPSGCQVRGKQAGVEAELSCSGVAACPPVIEAATRAGYLVGGCVPKPARGLASPDTTPSRLRIVLPADAVTGRAVSGTVVLEGDGSGATPYPAGGSQRSPSDLLILTPTAPEPSPSGSVSEPSPSGSVPRPEILTPGPTPTPYEPVGSPTGLPAVPSAMQAGSGAAEPPYQGPTSDMVVDWGDGTATTLSFSCWAVAAPRAIGWIGHIYRKPGSFTVTALAPADCYWPYLESAPQVVRVGNPT
jgi:hypothetical protein